MPSPEATPQAPAAFRWQRALRWAELAAVGLAALFALVFQLRLPGRLPSEADHRAAAAYLKAHAQPGDAVLLFPWWTERARLFLPPSLDVVAYLDQDEDPLVDARRVWVYAQPELPRADSSGFLARFEPERRKVDGPQRFGTIQLQLYENGRHRPTLFSATDSVASARVYLELPDRRIDCPFDGKAHRCPGAPEHVRVGAEWHEVFYQPRHCLWMHPPGGPGRLVAELPPVPPGDELALEAGVVWEWAYARGPGITPVRLGVEDATNGQPLIGLTIPPGLQQLQRATASPPPAAPTPVKIWIQSDRPDARGTCVELKSRGKRATGAM